MIGIPCVPEPSTLLWIEGLSLRASTLRDECLQIRAAGRRRSCESLFHDAQDLFSQQDGGGCATVLIHLSDICRAQGKLGPALRFSQEAERIFLAWPKITSKHNHAVALYSLGLIHHLLGSEKEAWDYYALALDVFEEAKQQWQTLPASPSHAADWIQRCDNAISWIKLLMAYVARSRARDASSAIRSLVLIGCWPPDTEPPGGDRMLVDVTVKRIVTDLRLRLDNDEYRLETGPNAVHPDPGTILPGEEYHLLPVPNGLNPINPPFGNSKYALIHKGKLTARWGVGIARGTTDRLWGTFQRTAGGGVDLHVAHPVLAAPPPMVVPITNLEPDSLGSIVATFEQA